MELPIELKALNGAEKLYAWFGKQALNATGREI
jgi:hypothetical protein